MAARRNYKRDNRGRFSRVAGKKVAGAIGRRKYRQANRNAGRALRAYNAGAYSAGDAYANRAIRQANLAVRLAGPGVGAQALKGKKQRR